MGTLTVKNWADFQHYKDRAPPWIKLHKGLLDNYEYQCLPVASRALAPMLWLLASESINGEIDSDPKKLAFRLRASEKEIIDGLNPLIKAGFLFDASGVLAECKQDAIPETETETETETELPPSEVGKTGKPVLPPCPIDEIVNLYHDTCPTLPKFQVRNETRDGYIRARWKQFFAAGDFETKEGGLDCFRWFFADRVRPSKFLTGQSEGRNGKKPFVADLEWLMLPSNFAKVIEGKYT